MAKQSSTTHKNGKARKAREQHNIQVEIIYRRDFGRLQERVLEIVRGFTRD
jgi:hypothetical protein